jgi:UDP-N-acetylenolpyruvoylglucosamine reductase
MSTIVSRAEDADAAVAELRLRVAGDVATPVDANWDEARSAWNLAADQRPRVVVIAESAEDVLAAVDFARANGLRVTAQGTGHGAGPKSWDDDLLLVKLERMRGVEIDAAAGIARVEAGAQWQDVTHPAAEHGLAALSGSSPDVGVVGYTLGGGLSWLARRHGIAANSVVAVDVVKADGTLVRASADNESELFWAIRGGGGNFGVVTAIEFTLYPIATVYAGMMLWPLERATEVLEAYSAWTETVDEDVTSTGRVLNLPPIPDIPEPFRGRSFVGIEAVFLGGQEAGEPSIAGFRALEPELDTFATIPMPALSHMHMDPEHPVPGVGDGMLLDEFGPETIAALMPYIGPGANSPLLSVEIRHIGGAVAREPQGAGALGSIEAPFVLFGVGIPMSPEVGAAIGVTLDGITEAMTPYVASQRYFNFAERPADPATFYGSDERYARLREIKSAVDPDGLFRGNHSIR